MPNWCNNTITLTHTEPSMIDRARTALNTGSLLHEFIPVPQELRDTISGCAGDKESYAQRLLEFQEKLNQEFFGYKNWYDFCNAEWGIKWDIGLDQGRILTEKEHTIEFTCMTPWGPPIEAYQKLSDLGFEIEATYYEPGMGFCGYWDNCESDHFDVKNDAEWVRDNIPTLIDFNEGISEGIEQMKEWETENA